MVTAFVTPLVAVVDARARWSWNDRGVRGSITMRQLQVLKLLAEGLTNAEIADRLVLSVRTVDSHVAAVFDKLGARNRRDATRRAANLGVLGPET